jgi:hypothetical protein
MVDSVLRSRSGIIDGGDNEALWSIGDIRMNSVDVDFTQLVPIESAASRDTFLLVLTQRIQSIVFYLIILV